MGKHSSPSDPSNVIDDTWTRASTAECLHYFVKQNGTWTCTMCGATR